MWKTRLVGEMNDPKNERFIFADDRIAVLRDRFPKAERHFLVLPQEDISNIFEVTQDDLKLLKYMDRKAREVAQKYGGGRAFKFGYHAEASMERLHLHVISDDMNSPGLKKMRHWNSFNTPNFLESSKVIRDLEISGKVEIPSRSQLKEFLEAPLRCHKCHYEPTTIFDLKRHILKHLR